MDRTIDRLAAGLAQGMGYVTALTDEAMQILWISPSVADLVGWTADEIVGRNAMELVHPDDLDGVARVLAAERLDPHPYGSDPARRSVNRVRFLDSFGGWRSVDIAANNQCHNPDVRGFVFILSDTTAQRLLDDVYDSMNLGMPVQVPRPDVRRGAGWERTVRHVAAGRCPLLGRAAALDELTSALISSWRGGCVQRRRRRRSVRRAGSPAPCRSRACAAGAAGRPK